MTALLAWFTSSIGKVVAKWGAILAVVGGIAWKIYASGKADQTAKDVADKFQKLRDREKVDDNVAKMPADAVHADLARWVRDAPEVTAARASSPSGRPRATSRRCRIPLPDRFSTTIGGANAIAAGSPEATSRVIHVLRKRYNRSVGHGSDAFRHVADMSQDIHPRPRRALPGAAAGVHHQSTKSGTSNARGAPRSRLKGPSGARTSVGPPVEEDADVAGVQQELDFIRSRSPLQPFQSELLLPFRHVSASNFSILSRASFSAARRSLTLCRSTPTCRFRCSVSLELIVKPPA